MHSRYVPGKLKPIFDGAVSQVLEECFQDGGGAGMVIAIENDHGDVYRVIETIGMGEYMHAVLALVKLGLQDVLKDSIGTATGYDSRFVVPAGGLEHSHALQIKLPVSAHEDIELALSELDALPTTEREAQILARLGQGRFRKDLMEYWSGCAVTGIADARMLRASHIKPWRVCSYSERLDAFNGLLLAPNLDAAFDAGLISFENSGRVQISSQLDPDAAYQLHISKKQRLNAKLFTDRHRAYLAFHREHVFQR